MKFPDRDHVCTCLVCGGQFLSVMTAKLCSDECRKKHARIIQPYKPKPMMAKLCIVCGTGFSGHKHVKRCTECRV